MKCLRKKTALAKILLALFMVSLFAPVSIAASTHERNVDGIVICTTSGLKLLTAAGEIVPHDEHKKSLSRKHCSACFLTGLAGNFAQEFTSFVAFFRISKGKTRPLSLHLASPSWVKSSLGARAPPV